MARKRKLPLPTEEPIELEVNPLGYEVIAKSDEGPHDKHLILPNIQQDWHIPMSWCFCKPVIIGWDRMNNVRTYRHIYAVN